MKTKLNSVDIIVPVYNVERYLRRCIDSVLSQTFSNVRLILVDDESTDSSGRICDEYSKKDQRVYVIHKKNGGVSSARNTGMEYSLRKKDGWIYFLDSDDWIEPDTIASLVKLGQSGNPDIVMANYRPIINKSKDSVPMQLHYNVDEIRDILFNSLLSTRQFNPKFDYIQLQVIWNKLIKKELVQNLRFNEKIFIGEDTIFFMELLPHCREIFYIDKKFYNYDNERSGSATRMFEDKLLSSRLNSNIVLNEIISRHYPNNKKMKETLYQRSFSNLAMMSYMFLSKRNIKYSERRARILHYLNNEFYREVLEWQNTKKSSIRVRCELFMLNHRILIYFYILGIFRRATIN